jgi:hypothetical protein
MSIELTFSIGPAVVVVAVDVVVGDVVVVVVPVPHKR